MSLHKLANTLQKKGRHGDSMLVHMTPKEVSGLHALAKAHGTSLTVNPDTGLVEAFSLKQLLPSLIPMAAGAALSVGSGGALSPIAAGMMVGGGYGIATGSVEKGLMAGLGAYGGADLATGLASAGASTAATEAKVAADAATAANAGVIPSAEAGVSAAGGDVAASGFSYAPSGEMVPSNYAPSITGAAPAAAAPTSGIASLTPAEISMFTPEQQQLIAAQRQAVVNAPGAQNIVQQPGGGISASQMGGNLKAGAAQTFKPGGEFSFKSMADYVGNNYGKIGAALAPVAAAALEPQPLGPVPEDEYEEGPYKLKRLSANFQGYVPARPNPYYRPTGLGYAAGGFLDNMPNGGLAALQSARDGYGAAQTQDGNIPQMAAGGQLGGYSDGGRMLKGPGDGMSDSIPANINGKQPARLADGEFVVPADVVSHLGNGSTDAGAKKLYAMMSKVRSARTGKKGQAPAIKSTKYIPA